MTKHFKILITVSCAVVLALAIATVEFREGTGTTSMGKIDEGELSSHRSGERFQGAEKKLHQDRAPGLEGRSGALPDQPSSEVSEAGSVASSHGQESGQIEVLPDQLQDTNENVSGRPFPLSPSVMRTCGSKLPDQSECPRLMEFVREFEQESRNVVWAQDIERRLAKALDYPDPGKYILRRIECRSSRCVAEVSAPYEWNLGDLDSFPDLSARLYGPVVGDLGFEVGANGEKIIVTVLGFERR